MDQGDQNFWKQKKPPAGPSSSDLISQHLQVIQVSRPIDTKVYSWCAAIRPRLLHSNSFQNRADGVFLYPQKTRKSGNQNAQNSECWAQEMEMMFSVVVCFGPVLVGSFSTEFLYEDFSLLVTFLLVTFSWLFRGPRFGREEANACGFSVAFLCPHFGQLRGPSCKFYGYSPWKSLLI